MKCSCPRLSRVSGSSNQRTGGAMVFVIILLVLVSLMGVTLTRLVLAQHRQRLNDELRAQAVRIADAGWNRALLKLTQNSEYPGESWTISENVFPSGHPAEVRIEVKPSAEDPAVQQLTVTAEYPQGSPQVKRVTHAGTWTKTK